MKNMDTKNWMIVINKKFFYFYNNINLILIYIYKNKESQQ